MVGPLANTFRGAINKKGEAEIEKKFPLSLTRVKFWVKRNYERFDVVHFFSIFLSLVGSLGAGK